MRRASAPAAAARRRAPREHAGRAEAALQRVLPRKCRAQFLHDRIVVEAFDRLHDNAVALNRVGDAGTRRLVVDQLPCMRRTRRARSRDAFRSGGNARAGNREMGARLDHRLNFRPFTLSAIASGANTWSKARVTAAAARRARRIEIANRVRQRLAYGLR